MKNELNGRIGEVARLKSLEQVRLKKLGQQKNDMLQEIATKKRDVEKKQLSVKYLEKEIKVRQMEHIERAIE
jgi:hypothetical protein